MRIAVAVLGVSIALSSYGCGNGDDTLAPIPPADASSDAKSDVTVAADSGGSQDAGDAATTTSDAGDAGKADAETGDAETPDAGDAGDAGNGGDAADGA